MRGAFKNHPANWCPRAIDLRVSCSFFKGQYDAPARHAHSAVALLITLSLHGLRPNPSSQWPNRLTMLRSESHRASRHLLPPPSLMSASALTVRAAFGSLSHSARLHPPCRRHAHPPVAELGVGRPHGIFTTATVTLSWRGRSAQRTAKTSASAILPAVVFLPNVSISSR
jgi:hypothetical protein